MYPLILTAVDAVSAGHVDGSQFNSYAKIIKIKEIKTKLGSEMNIITNVEMVWSVIVFFFKAAQTPSAIPIGTEKITEIIFSLIEYPIREPIIVAADTFG